MTTISPSILSADFSHLGADCRMVLDAGAQMLHYDVMDGHFVPNISFGVPVLKSLHKALPDAFYDVHLMITHPQQYAEAFAKAGASLLNFHLECDDDIQETIDAIKAQGCKVGMTIKPGTPVEELGYYLDQLDLVLVMSVEPGFGGQKFMPSALDKLRWLKAEKDRRGLKWKWTAAWMLPPLRSASPPVRTCWWRAAPSLAPPTPPRPSVRWQLSERGLPMDEALIRLQEEELQRTGRYYKHICFLCVPLLCVSCYLYGLRPLLLCGFAVLMGNLCDRLISLLRHRVYQAGDYSNESFALVITLLMPATVDWYVLAAAILAGALIGKEVFGGYGSYPFHPAAVGYAVAAVSWPEQVFRYPAPYANIPLWDASGVATSSTISDTLRSGGLINISALSLVLGEYAAPMGTGAAIVLVACGLFLWMQKDVRLSASLSFLITAGLIVFFFPRQLGLTEGTAFTAGLVFRLRCVRDEMLTGAMLFSAVFLLNEPYTCAHHRRGRILYGAMVGAFTMGFRYFGVYETGVCFAILAVNSISGWLDRTEVRLHELIKSGRYFKEKKTGKGDAE